MRFSIIIPTYNRCDYLESAINSAIRQKDVELEVLVMDNASTDGTPELMKQWSKDPRVKYIRQKSNIGMIPNWRSGVYDFATGDWVIILSDDDELIDDGYLSKAEALISQNKELVIVHGNRIVSSDKRDIVDRRILPEVCNGEWMFLNYLRTPDVMFTFVTGLFNRNLATSLGCFNSSNVVGSDTMEFLRMSLHGDIGFISDVVAKYRVHDDNPYFRFGVKYLLTDNIKTFEKPYQDALDKGVMNLKILHKWKRRMITQYIESNLREIYLKGKGDVFLLKEFSVTAISLYPYSVFAFIKIKSILRLLKYWICK